MIQTDISFFDNAAALWDQREIHSTPQAVSRILDIIKINEGMHVLDLGTGTGILVPQIIKRIGQNGRLLAVDFSEGMLERARSKHSGLTHYDPFVRADFERERLPGRYHRIILYCVYPHLYRPVSTIKKLVSQNLTTNGTLTIAFPTNSLDINNAHRHNRVHSLILPSSVSLAMHLRSHHIVATATSNNPYIVTVTRR